MASAAATVLAEASGTTVGAAATATSPTEWAVAAISGSEKSIVKLTQSIGFFFLHHNYCIDEKINVVRFSLFNHNY